MVSQPQPRSTTKRAAATAGPLLGLAVSLLQASGAAANASGDFCPPGLVYAAAIQCGPGGPVALTCVDEPLRTDLCTLPDPALGQALCDQLDPGAEPSLFLPYTGCHDLRIAQGPWIDIFNITSAEQLPPNNTYTRAEVCELLPAVIPNSFLASLATTETFERADPLAAWTITESNATNGAAAEIVCNGDAPPAGSMTFTDTIDTAAEGQCALRVRGGCAAVPGPDGADVLAGATNAAIRRFRVYDGGCSGASSPANAYLLRYSVAHDTDLTCFDNTIVPVDGTDYYIDFDNEPEPEASDTSSIGVLVRFGVVTVVPSFFDICDGDASDWIEQEIFLRVPSPTRAPLVVGVGSTVVYDFRIAATNDGTRGCEAGGDPQILVDNLRLLRASVDVDDLEA